MAARISLAGFQGIDIAPSVVEGPLTVAESTSIADLAVPEGASSTPACIVNPHWRSVGTASSGHTCCTCCCLR